MISGFYWSGEPEPLAFVLARQVGTDWLPIYLLAELEQRTYSGDFVLGIVPSWVTRDDADSLGLLGMETGHWRIVRRMAPPLNC